MRTYFCVNPEMQKNDFLGRQIPLVCVLVIERS
jgi:hypothetical protein